MGKILFAKFLEDKRVYQLAFLFWKHFFQRLADAANVSYTPYLNVGGDHDGNPIFHAYLPERQRALRIIQVDPSEATGTVDIKAWIDEVQPSAAVSAVPELVIDMVLSEGAKEVGQRLIQEWIRSETTLGAARIRALLEKG